MTKLAIVKFGTIERFTTAGDGVPEMIRGVPDEAEIGWVANGGSFLAPDTVATWHVDERGQKNGRPGVDLQPVECRYADRMLRDAASGAWRPVTDEDRVGAAKATAAAAIRAQFAAARQQLSGASDPYKAAVYNQRAAYGRMIVAGAGSEAMLAVAASECLRLAEADAAGALKLGLVAANGAAIPAAIAALWVSLDERLATIAAAIDRNEADQLAAIDRRRTEAGVAEALDSGRSAFAAFVQEAKQLAAGA